MLFKMQIGFFAKHVSIGISSPLNQPSQFTQTNISRGCSARSFMF